VHLYRLPFSKAFPVKIAEKGGAINVYRAWISTNRLIFSTVAKKMATPIEMASMITPDIFPTIYFFFISC
jgi:hypothetical protein